MWNLCSLHILDRLSQSSKVIIWAWPYISAPPLTICWTSLHEIWPRYDQVLRGDDWNMTIPFSGSSSAMGWNDDPTQSEVPWERWRADVRGIRLTFDEAMDFQREPMSWLWDRVNKEMQHEWLCKHVANVATRRIRSSSLAGAVMFLWQVFNVQHMGCEQVGRGCCAWDIKRRLP